MTDFLYKGRIASKHLAFAYAVTTRTVQETVLRHDCDPAGAHLLGRALTAGLLAATTLPPDSRINLKWAYGGTLKTILVDAGPDATVRGMISPNHLFDAKDAEELYGSGGTVKVIRSQNGVNLSAGTVEAGFQDPIEDFAFFLSFSDQVESALEVLLGLAPNPGDPVRVCRGILLQALPECDLEAFNHWRARLNHPSIRDHLYHQNEETDNYLENILARILEAPLAPGDLVIESLPAPRFACTCSREKMGAVLRALPYDERMDMVKKGDNIRISCHYCRELYELTIQECIEAWNEFRKKPPA
ncbi:MAG TPA: Hsp33 family molecular chaperone HslO [Kiritimatiellia bacterium]|nr:Hsp33 family molecular chaperone HslO [Kiritimatiellia bacterium]